MIVGELREVDKKKFANSNTMTREYILRPVIKEVLLKCKEGTYAEISKPTEVESNFAIILKQLRTRMVRLYRVVGVAIKMFEDDSVHYIAEREYNGLVSQEETLKSHCQIISGLSMICDNCETSDEFRWFIKTTIRRSKDRLDRTDNLVNRYIENYTYYSKVCKELQDKESSVTKELTRVTKELYEKKGQSPESNEIVCATFELLKNMKSNNHNDELDSIIERNLEAVEEREKQIMFRREAIKQRMAEIEEAKQKEAERKQSILAAENYARTKELERREKQKDFNRKIEILCEQSGYQFDEAYDAISTYIEDNEYLKDVKSKDELDKCIGVIAKMNSVQIENAIENKLAAIKYRIDDYIINDAPLLAMDNPVDSTDTLYIKKRKLFKLISKADTLINAEKGDAVYFIFGYSIIGTRTMGSGKILAAMYDEGAANGTNTAMEGLGQTDVLTTLSNAYCTSNYQEAVQVRESARLYDGETCVRKAFIYPLYKQTINDLIRLAGGIYSINKRVKLYDTYKYGDNSSLENRNLTRYSKESLKIRRESYNDKLLNLVYRDLDEVATGNKYLEHRVGLKMWTANLIDAMNSAGTDSVYILAGAKLIKGNEYNSDEILGSIVEYFVKFDELRVTKASVTEKIIRILYRAFYTTDHEEVKDIAKWYNKFAGDEECSTRGNSKVELNERFNLEVIRLTKERVVELDEMVTKSLNGRG